MNKKRCIASTLALCAAGFLAGAGDLRAATSPDESARFLAGKGAPAGSPLGVYTRTAGYRRHAGQVQDGWTRFLRPNLERLRAWWKPYAPATYSTVLYPFSGPDIVNALALFPDADTYILFGLESPGAVPDLATMDAAARDTAALDAGLAGLREAVATFFRANFFFTKEMGRRLGRDAYSGVAGLMLFFLALDGREVTAVRRITSGAEAVPGVEIGFRRPGGKAQLVRYFMLDVADAALEKQSPDFIPYLRRAGRCVTLLKAASYLMHADSAREAAPHFDRIRELVLGQSDFIVQDDSGIPLRRFPRGDWKLRFHGKYGHPVREFAHRLQKDLWNATRDHSTGPLPFSFGYDNRPGASNLLTAERVR